MIHVKIHLGAIMGKFIIGIFLLLGFGFYQLSGGANFEPEVRPLETAAIATKSIAPVPFNEPVVTRAVVEPTEIAPVVEEELDEVALEVEPVVQAPTVVAAPLDLRTVAGSRVNMRAGPGTNFGVLDTLAQGTEAEVIEVDSNGWAQIRITSTDQVGWMAERLLTDG